MASMRIAMKNALREKEEQDRKEAESKEKEKEKEAKEEEESRNGASKKKRTVTKPAARSKSRAKRRKVESSSDDDDDDASNSSSDDSSDDSDSDSSSSDSSEDEVDVEALCMKELGYGQNLYKNDEERQTFEAMPETEREKVLFERYEKRKSLLETLKLRQTQKAQTKTKTKSRSKKGKKVRIKEPPKRQVSSRKAKELKAQAAAHKDMKKRRNRVVKSDDDSSNSSISSSSDSESDSNDKMSVDEEAPGEKTAKAGEPQETVKKEGLVTLADINRMLIKRDMIIKWIEEPFFNQIIGGFVRLSIGSADPNDPQVKVYRLCEIVGMKELSNPYQLEGKHIDQELVLQFAKDAKNWPVDRLSNQDITQSEFDYWAVRMHEAKQGLPTKDDADEFVQRVKDKIVNYVYTEEDILRKIERKKSRRRRAVNLTAEIMDLKRRIKFHSDSGNHAEATKLKAELVRTQRHLDSVKRKKEESERAMIEINRRNFIKNETERERSRAQRKIKKNVNQDNPYVSIPCRPKNLWATGYVIQKLFTVFVF